MIHLVTIADLHCGHKKGLTPPNWVDDDAGIERWERYERMAIDRQLIAPVDILVVNGDAVDGKGYKSGGTELITTDRRIQAHMAREAIEVWNADTILMTYGTGYHTGFCEDWEDVVADLVGARIKSELFLDVEGVPCSFKHKVGTSSSAEHTRWTPLMKERSWDKAWAEEKKQHPKAWLLVRSHVHYHIFGGRRGPEGFLAMITPALQGLGSKFGERQCLGIVDWGITWMFFSNGELTDWDVEMDRIETEVDEVFKYSADVFKNNRRVLH